MKKEKGSLGKKLLAFIVAVFILLALFFLSLNTGGIKISVAQLLHGVLVEYDKSAAIVWDMRVPRVIIAMLGGALMSVSGALMQAVMRNPLADPGIIGISSGAALFGTLLIAFLPSFGMLLPLFAFCGGMLTFALVYILAWNRDSSPVRFILTGIAVNALCGGLYDALNSASGGNASGAAGIVSANISLKTWNDVKSLVIYALIAAILCLVVCRRSNLLSLSDETITSLGVNVGRLRFTVSAVSVLMASLFAAAIGTVSFLGLIVPHIAKLLVGSEHKILLPYSALLGAAIFLLADTLGRSIAYPYEISPSIIMAVIGAPLFIVLLKRNKESYGE